LPEGKGGREEKREGGRPILKIELHTFIVFFLLSFLGVREGKGKGKGGESQYKAVMPHFLVVSLFNKPRFEGREKKRKKEENVDGFLQLWQEARVQHGDPSKPLFCKFLFRKKGGGRNTTQSRLWETQIKTPFKNHSP